MYLLLTLLFGFCLWLFVRKRISDYLGTKVTTYIIILALTLSTILSLSLFFKYDKETSVHGLGYIFCTKQTMPFGISSKRGNYADGLVLVDDADFELIGKGFKYQCANFEMENFLAYGYNDTSILVQCTDNLRQIKYLISYKTGYKSKRGNDEISFENLTSTKFSQIKQKYTWVVLDEEQIRNIPIKKNLLLVGIVVSLFFFIKEIINLKNVKDV